MIAIGASIAALAVLAAIFWNLPLITCWASALVLVIMALIELCWRRDMRPWSLALRAVAVAWLCALAVVTALALDRGLYSLYMPLGEVVRDMPASPIDESDAVPDTGERVLAFYRFDCPDCHATRRDIDAWASENSIDLYWVSTRSERGAELFDRYRLHRVPTIVAVNGDERALARQAYVVDDDGTVRVDAAATSDILAFLQKGTS